MAEQPIKGTDIIESGMFNEAVKQADNFIAKLSELETGIKSNLQSSKEYLSTWKAQGSETLNTQAKATAEVTKELKQLEQLEQQRIKTEIAKSNLLQANEKAILAQIKNEQNLQKAVDAETKALEKQNRELQKQNSEYSKASKELTELKKKLKDLSIAGKENTNEFKKLSKEFEVLDSKVRKADTSVGDFQRFVGNYPKQLKEMQKALMDLEPGTDEFNRLAKKAGELKDKIQDAKDATKAFANESKTASAKNLFSQIANDISDLDFKGASEKAKTFASVVRTISFTEVLTGIKSFGSALLDVGKALLFNPFTLLIAGVTALGYAIYDLTKSYSALGETTETVNESLRKSQERIDGILKRQLDYMLKIKVARNELTKEQGKQVQLELDQIEERKKSAKEYSEKVLALAKKLDLNISEIQGNRFKENYTGDINQLNRRKHFNLDMIKLEKQNIIDSKQLIKAQILERTALIEEQKAEIKAKESNIKVTNELNKLKIKESQPTESIALKKNAEVEIKKQGDDEILKNMEKHNADINSIGEEQTAKLDAELKKRDDLKQKEVDRQNELNQKMITAFAEAEAEKSKLKQDALQRDINDTEKNIDRQRELADKGKTNTLAEEEKFKAQKQVELEKEKEQEIKRQKAIAIFKAFTSYMEQGDDTITAIAKAVGSVAIVDSIAGAFFTGTEKVADDLQDKKLHNGRDGYRIAVDGSERIMTGEQNKLVGDLSNVELANLANDYNNGLLDTAKYAVIQKDFASNVKESVMLMQMANLNKQVESLTNTIKQRPVSNFEFDGYGNFIKETIENGFNKRTTYKQEKPRI